MKLDKFCYCLILSLLPILILPLDWLVFGIIGAVILFLIALKQRQILLFILSLLIALSYGRIYFFAENLQKQTAYKSTEIIRIQQILKEIENPTAIARRENGNLIYLRWQSETPLILEQKYRAELQLRPVSARLNSGNFNRQRWYIARHITATANVKNAEEILEQSVGIRSQWLDKIRARTEGLSTQGLILALAFGERAWLKAEQWQLFQQTATAHLIAISGLHIALAMAIGFWVGKIIALGISWFCYQFKLKQAVKNAYFFAIFCGFLTAWGYSFLAGFAIPTVRAVIAISLILMCHWARKHYTPWQYWLRCVSLLIVFDPFSLLSDSFWLSILAVAALIFWYRYFPLNDFYQAKNIMITPVAKLFHLQIGILFCFLPVQLYFFGGLSFSAFLANLLIVPFYSLLIVPLILFSLLSDNLLHSWQLVDFLLQGSLGLLEPLSHSWLNLSEADQWGMICASFFCLSLIYWRKTLKARLSLLITGFLALYQSYFYWQDFQQRTELEWIFFDVGQGLAMAFIYFDDRGTKRAVLYDTAASWDGGSIAEMEIIPYLKRQKIALDSIIISHDDNDHAGGVPPLLAEYPQTKIITPSQIRYSENSEPCIGGKSWKFSKLKLSAIYPLQTVARAKNEHSCIMLGEIGQYRFLLTGDSGIEQERQFALKTGKIDFLQVGHHGSKSSTSYTLLAASQPKYAFISAARFNLWKMPHHRTLSKLDEFTIQYLNTAQTGMLRIKFYPKGYQIITARNQFSPWYSAYFGK